MVATRSLNVGEYASASEIDAEIVASAVRSRESAGFGIASAATVVKTRRGHTVHRIAVDGHTSYVRDSAVSANERHWPPVAQCRTPTQRRM